MCLIQFQEMSKITIGIAEDHTLLRDYFIQEIKANDNFNLIALSSNGKLLLAELERSNIVPEIVALDLCMPVMNGTETARVIKKLYPNTKILVISALSNENTIINLFNIGINGFASKTEANFNYMSSLIEIVENGYLSNKYYRKPTEAKLNWDKYAFIGKIKLTHNELEFVRLITQNFSIKEIAQQLNYSPRTIENYRDAIYLKLGVNSQIDIMKFALEIGYI